MLKKIIIDQQTATGVVPDANRLEETLNDGHIAEGSGGVDRQRHRGGVR